jgi:uracil-DNA glycosylase
MEQQDTFEIKSSRNVYNSKTDGTMMQGNGELLNNLKKRAESDQSLPLRETAKNLVFGKGNPNAEIFIAAEAPGANEDIQGIPFVGAAGKELDKLLRSINLTLDEVYIANILKFRPPNNRDPTMDEIRAHTPYLIEQIKIIQPRIICTLGNFATKFVLASFNPDKMKSIGGITHLHGKQNSMHIDGMTFTVFPLYHPAAMLYNPKLRKDLEADFLAIGAFLGKSPAENVKRNDTGSLSKWM